MVEKEKGMVEAYKNIGKSIRWMRNNLGRHVSCNNIGRKKKKRGPKQKISGATKRLIIRKASNKATSFERIKSELDLNVSKETIRHVLKNFKTIRFQKMKVNRK